MLALLDIQRLAVGSVEPGSRLPIPFRRKRRAENGRYAEEARPEVIRKKEVDGEHPASDYLVVEDPKRPETWHLRVRDVNGKPDHRLMGAAWAALHGGFRGQKYEGPQKQEASARLTRLYQSEGLELPLTRRFASPSPRQRGEGWFNSSSGLMRGEGCLNSSSRLMGGEGCLNSSSGLMGGEGCLNSSSGLMRGEGAATSGYRSPVQFVAALSETPAKGVVRIPLAVTGTWVRGSEKFSITRQDLESIARNFARRKNGEINVDYDHASEMPEVAAGGPIPSAGRIVKIEEPEPVEGSGNSGVVEQRSRGAGELVSGSRKAAGRSQKVERKFKVQSGEFKIAEPRLHFSTSPLLHFSSTPRFILWGWYEPTARARALIRQGEYRYISPAIDWGARSKRTGQPQGATLTSVALTNRPFLEELPQIHLSDPSYRLIQPGAGSQQSEGRRMSDSAARLIDVGEVHVETSLPQEDEDGSQESGVRSQKEGSAADPAMAGPTQQRRTGDHRSPLRQQGGFMKKVEVSAQDGKVALSHPDFTDEYYADPEELQAILEEMGLTEDPAEAMQEEIPLEQAVAALSETETRGKRVAAVEVFRARVEQALEDAVKAGKILPRQREEWRRIGLTDFATFSKLLSEQPARVPLRPIGFSGTGPVDAGTQVKFLAEQRMRERGIRYGQALSELGREQPDLIQKYRRAVSGE